MKIISTKAHGVMDYVMALLLIASPWLFNFDENNAAKSIPIFLGIVTICYSLITNYEMGISKTLSMRSHLTLDLISGALLAASPWIFDFNEYVYLPHLILGIAEIGVVLLTDPIPFESARGREGNPTAAH